MTLIKGKTGERGSKGRPDQRSKRRENQGTAQQERPVREWNIGTCLKCTSVFIRVIAENETVDTVLFNSKYNYVTTMGEY